MAKTTLRKVNNNPYPELYAYSLESIARELVKTYDNIAAGEDTPHNERLLWDLVYHAALHRLDRLDLDSGFRRVKTVNTPHDWAMIVTTTIWMRIYQIDGSKEHQWGIRWPDYSQTPAPTFEDGIAFRNWVASVVANPKSGIRLRMKKELIDARAERVNVLKVTEDEEGQQIEIEHPDVHKALEGHRLSYSLPLDRMLYTGKITQRDKEIFSYIGLGWTTKRIADWLWMKHSNVRQRVKVVRDKVAAERAKIKREYQEQWSQRETPKQRAMRERVEKERSTRPAQSVIDEVVEIIAAAESQSASEPAKPKRKRTQKQIDATAARMGHGPVKIIMADGVWVDSRAVIEVDAPVELQEVTV